MNENQKAILDQINLDLSGENDVGDFAGHLTAILKQIEPLDYADLLKDGIKKHLGEEYDDSIVFAEELLAAKEVDEFLQYLEEINFSKEKMKYFDSLMSPIKTQEQWVTYPIFDGMEGIIKRDVQSLPRAERKHLIEALDLMKSGRGHGNDRKEKMLTGIVAGCIEYKADEIRLITAPIKNGQNQQSAFVKLIGQKKAQSPDYLYELVDKRKKAFRDEDQKTQAKLADSNVKDQIISRNLVFLNTVIRPLLVKEKTDQEIGLELFNQEKGTKYTLKDLENMAKQVQKDLSVINANKSIPQVDTEYLDLNSVVEYTESSNDLLKEIQNVDIAQESKGRTR